MSGPSVSADNVNWRARGRPRPLSADAAVIPPASQGTVTGSPPLSPRQPLSPASIVQIKQTFSKAARNARNRSAGLADWEGVRGRPARQGTDAPRTAVPSLLSPPLVDEPGSYEQPNGKQNGQQTSYHESSSEDSHSGDEYTQFKKAGPVQSIWRIPNLTAQQRGIIKCSIAYTIATLFTFVPVLSGLLAAPFDLEGPVRGGHVVATVATYYNPAKTLGAMFEAVCLAPVVMHLLSWLTHDPAQDIFMLWASFFAFITAIGSMATASFLNDVNQHTLSHVLSVLWLMAAMGLVAWMKVKVSHPQFGSVSLHVTATDKRVAHASLFCAGMFDGRTDSVRECSDFHH